MLNYIPWLDVQSESVHHGERLPWPASYQGPSC